MAAATLVAVMPATGAAQSTDAQPGTTEAQTIVGDPDAPFSQLRSGGPGWTRVVRGDLASAAQARERRRRSLLYLAALDELHYTDEESPARVEFLDYAGTPFTSAWFPFEALRAHAIDQTFRSVNRFVPASPVADGNGRRARMALALTTGDSADNQHVNEVRGYVGLLEGGRFDPNSGTDTPACAAGPIPAGEAGRYTGVQDYDDYAETDAFYDPDQPIGRWSEWPRYPGLMDRAQQPFDAAGLSVPSYVTLGNHDRLAQGNQWANAGFERIATGCTKPFAEFPLGSLTPSALATSPDRVAAVPPDPARAYVDNPTLRALHATGRQDDAHGFGYVDKTELEASRGAASYYAWNPRPDLRFISINTVSEGGIAGISDKGNLDDPQFQWLARELSAAGAAGQLVVVFAHHPIASMTAQTPDEAAPPCGSGTERDPNAGCDMDPRDSRPIRLGGEVRDLFLANPSVVAFVAGHTTEHRVTPFKRADGSGGFWQLESGSVSDWPAQARLVELMDNRDRTLSIFGTLIDSAAPVAVPAPGTDASGFSAETLAALARTLAYNDPQDEPAASLGRPEDRNVELLLPDPFPAGSDRSRTASGEQGSARLFVGRRCRGRRVTFGVRGRRIARVTFFLDGRRVRTIRKADRSGRYQARGLLVKGRRRHWLRAVVRFENGAKRELGIRPCRA